MSAKQPRPYAQMLGIAENICNGLRHACERIEIAGSLRRGKSEVGDIEIVAIPKPALNLLGEPTKGSQVDAVLSSWPIAFTKSGPKYKQFLLFDSAEPIQVDLFLQPDPATWGVNFMLRTGSKEFGHKMVTPKWQGGYMPEQYYVKDARIWHDGRALATPEEEDVFALWGMEWIPPQYREGYASSRKNLAVVGAITN